jgi:WD40 repeat protein/3',5'-cyclic AMP phosphodiesterase CpdA
LAEQLTGGQSPSFIARVLGPDDAVGGLGALIGPRHVVTCAHVVNTALGRDALSQQQPRERVRVDFPLLADRTQAEAEVVMWRPPPGAGVAGDDIAGLELAGPPPRAAVARLAVEAPRAGRTVRVFGYPGDAPRPDGTWVATTVQGLVSNGRLQLDSRPDSAWRIQPGFSGSPVIDDRAGRVTGLLVTAAPDAARDSYAIGAERLRLAWPEVLGARWQPSGARGAEELTILHVSDPRFDREQPPGEELARLPADLTGLASPDLLVVTGNLAAQGLRSEFRQAMEFVAALAEEAEVPRRHVAIVPGNHDVNRRACKAYFEEQESDEEEPVPPYWPKWRQFSDAFRGFYAGLDTIAFTPDEPWTLFEMADLNVVVAGLNSTIADSHLAAGHRGHLGERQLRWFATRLADYRDQGWLRLAAVHHDPQGDGEGRLRDAREADRLLPVNLLLHGHALDARLHRLPSGLVALAGGDAPAAYQLITVRRDGFTRFTRRYASARRRWGGASSSHDYPLSDTDKAFPPTMAAQAQFPERKRAGSRSEFFDRVADATRARVPGAIVTERPEDGYLRVTVLREGGRVEQWPVGVIDGPATEEAVSDFVARVHRQFAAEDPAAQSELVYRMPAAPGALADFALRNGVLLRSLIEYQGLIDLRPLAEAQRERLAGDRIYPARLYVDQRYRIVSGGGHTDEVRTGLVERTVQWLGVEGARLIVVLGDFGRGKTSFLRQLTRELPARLPGVTPILVELRSLEKAPSLDELLAQHLVRQGVEDINPGKLRYMINSGRVALLLDGFDELELRVGYSSAADYLQKLLASVTGHAKVILTSRTQHFRSTEQVRHAVGARLRTALRRNGRTALGERIATRPESRVVVLEDFSDDQILQFLTNLYEGDSDRAWARYDLISGIGNLLDLAHNPRMLAFVADLDSERLRAAAHQTGKLSAADLYREIIDYWLEREAERQRHRGEMPAIGKQERLAACTALALRLWASKDPTIALHDLSAEVTATLTGLAERGYTEDQATHSIASGSLLVRTEDGAFSFIHQSVMEWLVAAAAASGSEILASRRMSRLMVAFFADLAGHDAARDWAARTLTDPDAPEVAKQNALDVTARAGASPRGQHLAGVDLAGVDLRGQDLTGRDLRGASLRGANLSGMRLNHADLTGADLTGADLTGAVMIGSSLRNATLTGSTWNRAAILGTAGTGLPADAAVADRDPAEAVIEPPATRSDCVAFSPDGALIAYGSGSVVAIAGVADGRGIRIVRGHAGGVTSVAFSPDGSLLATASDDHTARVWDVTTGSARGTIAGHDSTVTSVAFSPDGSLLATAAWDGTARIWDVASGTTRTTLNAHDTPVTSVGFSPDGSLLATSSTDRTARIWDIATGAPRTTLTGHGNAVTSVGFSPDGSLLATSSADRTARIWDIATGAPRTTLTGHNAPVQDAAFSPDGTLLATTAWDGAARAWDVATGATVITLSGHERTVTDVAFSPGGDLLATVSRDATFRIWEISTGTALATLAGHGDGVRSVAFLPDGDLLATTASGRTVRVWDVATGETRRTINGHESPVTAVAFSPDGTLLATTALDGIARIWVLGAGHIASRLRRRRTIQLEGHAGPLRDATFSPDGSLLATASTDHTARIWDIATASARTILAGHSGPVTAVAFSPDGALLATASADRTARVWDVATGAGHAVIKGHENSVTAVAFSPDGGLLATASRDGSARIWDATGAYRLTLTGHSGPLNRLAFSPDSSTVVTASDDGTTRIWDAATGAIVGTLVSFSGGYATLLPDGSYKLEGDPSDEIWWAIKLCRFAPGELDPYVPGLRRRDAAEPIPR